MIKKLISSCIITLFLVNYSYALSPFQVDSSNTSDYLTVPAIDYGTIQAIDKQIILSTNKIKKYKKGTSYLIQINKLTKTIDGINDLSILRKIKETTNTKLTNSFNVLGSTNNTNYEIYRLIDLKIQKRIIELEQSESNNAIKLINNPEISKDESKKVEDEIVKLQLNLLDNSKSVFEKLLKKIDDNLNYEDNGNFKFEVEGNYTNYGSGKAKLSMTNYNTKTVKFDSEIKTQIDLLVESTMKGQMSFKAQLSSFVNFITKDSNMYLLLNNLTYSGIEEIDVTGEIKNYIEKFKELSVKNEYLKIDNSKSNQKEVETALNLFKNFNLNDVYNESKNILKEPMFKPYKKVGDKYLILPSKKACDTIMAINYKINGSGNWYCSDSEYNDLIKELVSTGSFYITIGTNGNTLGFDLIDNPNVSLSVKLNYTDNKIENILVRADSKQKKTLGEFFELNYVNGQKLDILFNSKSENIDLSFKSLLDSSNSFIKIDYTGNFDKKIKSTFKLENNSFNGNFVITDMYYVNGKLAGTLKDKNLNYFTFDMSGKDTSINQDLFTSKWSLNNEVLSGITKIYKGNEEVLNIVSDGKYNTSIFELNNKLKIKDIYSKTSNSRNVSRITDLTALKSALEQHYQDNGNYPGVKDFNTILTYLSKIPTDPLGNVEIDGCKFGYVYEVGNDANGINNEKFKLSTCMENEEKYEVGDTGFTSKEKIYINGYTTWIKQEKQKTEDDMINSDLNIKYSGDNTNYNLEIFFDIIITNLDYIKASIKYDNKRTKGTNMNIKAPTKFKTIDEVFPKSNINYY